jgi:RNA polymerase sigma factor (sigma-70 family)
MTSRRVVSHQEIDLRLAPAVRDQELFEGLVEELAAELGARNADLEITDPMSWRRAGTGKSSTRSYLDQFRSDVDAILTMDREDEARLARRIEFARHRLLSARRAAGLDGDDLFTVLRGEERSRQVPRDVLRRTEELHALRSEMVERNLYLVLINVERYAKNWTSRVDLIQEGCASLFRAVDGFDWRRGLLFRTYAVHWLNQAFRNHLYNFQHTVRVPVYLQKALKHINQAQIRIGDPDATAEEIAASAELDEKLVSTAMSASRSVFSLDSSASEGEPGNRLRDMLPDMPEDEAEIYQPRMEDVSLHDGLSRALDRLSDRERLVVEMRFGLGEAEREHTLAEVAARLGVSVERVRQIQVRAVSKMNTPGLRRELDPYLN